MNVPKFASFQSKPATTPQPVPSSKDEESGRRKGHTRDRPKSDRRRRSRSRERRDDVRQIPLPREKPPVQSDVFVVDRRGDENNLIYGSVHRYSVPPFYRIGAGGVLGVSRQFKIRRELSDEKGIVLSDLRESRARKREKYVFSKMEKPRLLKLRPEAIVDDDSSIQADFMSLELPRGKKRKRGGDDDSPSSDSENESKHYRSIDGKAKSERPADSAFQYASESDSSVNGEASNESASARQKNVELNRRVEQHPNDFEAWHALIAHQDVLLQGDDDRRRITNAEVRSTADIKIHMYEKALAHAKCLADRERLLQGVMAEGSKIWEVKQQAERWEQISRDNIDSLLLWRSYLDFRQTTFATFQYEQVRVIYVDRFKLLLKEIAVGSSDRVTVLYQQLVYVLLRFTLFLREAGYTELSLGIWQANLEVNFRAPSTYKDLKADFQEYWESEVSRFGESESLGWDHFHRNIDDAEPAPVQIDEQHDFVEGNALFQSWATAERLRQRTSHILAKTMDETVEDDPFRVILFSDIEDFLFPFPRDSDTLRQSLLDAFCRFCRLPPITSDHPNWYSDTYMRGELIDANISWIKTQHTLSPTEDQERPIISALKYPSKDFISSPDTLFSQTWFKSLEPWTETYAGLENGPVSYTWLKNTVKQLLAANYSDDLAEYLLALEWRNEPATIKKSAKGLIKSHSDSLRLYNAYAMIEWSKGNKDVAAAVFTAALNMSISMPEEKRGDTILLWKSWIWACLEDGDNVFALKHLLAITDGTPNPSVETSPTALIRTKQHLTSNRDYLLTSGSTHKSIMYAECLALLTYLSPQPTPKTQGDLTSAISSVLSFSQTLTSRHTSPSTSPSTSAHHELLLQSATRLLFHHAHTGPYIPSTIRTHLSHFLTHYPHNTIFLSLYSWNETCFKIERRVRSLLSSSPTHPSTQLFKITWEMENGTIHSARAAFEGALTLSPTTTNTSSSLGNAGIWKLYLLFTHHHFGVQKAKEVWYRALRACPWVKELYIFGFEMLGGARKDEKGVEKWRSTNRKNEQGAKNNGKDEKVEFEELKGTWKVMGEKELRVHVDLEDIFEDVG